MSGTPARANALGAVRRHSGRDLDTRGMNRDQLRLGMSGSATAFAGTAGVIGRLASILAWVGFYRAYL